MLELRRGAWAAAAALLILTVGVSKSFAVESSSFTNTLGGASVGVPAGAAPPPGLYTGIQVVWPIPATAYGNAGASSPNPTGSALKIGATIGIVPLVWSTGWNVFGANYTVSAIQPFYTAFTCTSCSGPGPYAGNVLPTIANTVWQPVNLSWKLGGGWFFDAAFSFVAPDGSNWATTSNPDYWSFAPGWAISYLDKSWLLSANMAYFINTKSGGVCCALSGTTPGTGYLSGQEFYLDWTALYRVRQMGNWAGRILNRSNNNRCPRRRRFLLRARGHGRALRAATSHRGWRACGLRFRPDKRSGLGHRSVLQQGHPGRRHLGLDPFRFPDLGTGGSKPDRHQELTFRRENRRAIRLVSRLLRLQADAAIPRRIAALIHCVGPRTRPPAHL